MANIYSVKQINEYVKNLFAQDFLLPKVSVRGEISNLKYHSTGHIYFSLKDEDSVLRGVMFRSKRSTGLKGTLREGMKVVVTGEVGVYEATGSYQIYAARIEEEGQGVLFKRFEELKQKLGDMGLFDPLYKKPIPRYARTIGIVTSETGAALQDIINVTTRRNPYVQLVLSPALVQGEGAPESIVSAIEAMDRIRPDLMIVGRGGGSAEDLWAFNDERVAMAVFNADTPVISAVGHEIDFTIIDFVSDLRAPTPSAAAELAVFDYNAFQENLAALYNGMTLRMDRILSEYKTGLMKKQALLTALHPAKILENEKNRLELLKRGLVRSIEERFIRTENRFRVAAASLNGASPLKKLRGGYGAVSVKGAAVKSVKDVTEGDEVTITVHDGKFTGRVLDITEYENGGKESLH